VVLPSSPLALPRCEYPGSLDTDAAGLFQLPENMPAIDFSLARKYRSNAFKPVGVDHAEKFKLLEMARMVAKSFAEHEPMSRHVHPPGKEPDLIGGFHEDPFGKDRFGPWTKENILYWFIRMMVLTNSTDSGNAIILNADMLRLSLIITDNNSNPIGGAFNVTLSPEEVDFQKTYAFLDAVLIYMNPIMNKILSQEHEAVAALKEKYPSFGRAYNKGNVGMHFMIARSAKLPSEHTFELVAASAERFQHRGYEYMLVSASNQWTGAACEVLGGTPVHFSPFRKTKAVVEKRYAREHEPYSIDGYLSDKDSGMMFYAIKLQ